VVGALAGLAAGAVAAGVLAVLFSGAAAGMGAAWVSKLKWLVPPAVMAGIVVGVIDRDRP
jgi:Na+/H+-dicarboxylate symporter